MNKSFKNTTSCFNIYSVTYNLKKIKYYNGVIRYSFYSINLVNYKDYIYIIQT